MSVSPLKGLRERPELLFEVGQFELWYQPVYYIESGEVLHNEVLVRWRDLERNLYLPTEFMPALARHGLLPRLDRLVCTKVVTALTQDTVLCLSMNLAASSFCEPDFIEELSLLLQDYTITSGRLSFELPEGAIAQDFPRALKFCQILRDLGAGVILDNFSGQNLTLSQCRQLPLTGLKLADKFLPNLEQADFNEDAPEQEMTRAILGFARSLGFVTAKFITNEASLALAKQWGINTFQGNLLKQVGDRPEQLPLNTQAPSEDDLATVISTQSSQLIPQPKSPPPLPGMWGRFLKFSAFLGLGGLVLIVGGVVASYRLSHIVTEISVVNGTVVTMRSPMEANLVALYPQPGTKVKKNQVLVRLGITYDLEQRILQLQGDVAGRQNQLLAAQESLAFLESRLQFQESALNRLWGVQSRRSQQTMEEAEAVLKKAQFQVKGAQQEYNRYVQLANQGAVPQQEADLRRTQLNVARAEEERSRRNLRSTQIALNATNDQVAMNEYQNWADSYVSEITQLRQQIQNQKILNQTLVGQVTIAERQLKQAQSVYDKNKQMLLKAPIGGVVYSTKKEQGEALNRTDEILSILDCQGMWVETVLDARQANRIDRTTPVLIQFNNLKQPLKGEIRLIQGMSNQGEAERSQRLQSQALLATVPADLVGKPVSRVLIQLPETPAAWGDERFCGLGETARLTFPTRNFWER